MSDYLDPLARSSTVETMRRMIEAAEHERDVAQSMVKGRDDEIERLRDLVTEIPTLCRRYEARLAEAERLQGDLAVARIDLANAEMRERHLRAERDEREARLAEAEQLLKDATPRMMRRHPSSQSSYRSAWDRWLDRRNAFLNWRNDLGE